MGDKDDKDKKGDKDDKDKKDDKDDKDKKGDKDDKGKKGDKDDKGKKGDKAVVTKKPKKKTKKHVQHGVTAGQQNSGQSNNKEHMDHYPTTHGKYFREPHTDSGGRFSMCVNLVVTTVAGILIFR